MADNDTVDVSIANSVNGDASELDNFSAKKSDSNDRHLKDRIEELEREKRESVEEKEAEHAKLEKVMESITKRAFELEGEVVRLQHDLGTAMNAGDEAGKEIERLMREIDEVRREKSALAEELKTSESESGIKISELEKKIDELVDREREARRESAAAEEKAKARLDALEREIDEVKKEKTSLEAAMGKLEAELKLSEEKVIQMAGRIELLAKNTRESEDIIAGMVEKASQQRGIDDIVEEARERRGGFGGLKKKIPLPVAGAVSAGVVLAVVAVCCVKFSRTR